MQDLTAPRESFSRPLIAAVQCEGELHLWIASCREADSPHIRAELLEVLSDAERVRAQRFSFAADAHRYLLTRALVRTVLSRYLQIAPGRLRFETHVHGRPFVSDAADGGLSFNLSHTRDLVVCAVGSTGSVGVDTEQLGRTPAPLEIADRYFSRTESRSLRQIAAPLCDHRFYELWTLKEAYSKAVGRGLQIGLDAVQFDLDEDGAIRPTFSPALRESADACHFWLLAAPHDHLVSICWRGPTGVPALARQMQIVPSFSEQACRLALLRKSAAVVVV